MEDESLIVMGELYEFLNNSVATHAYAGFGLAQEREEDVPFVVELGDGGPGVTFRR